MRTKLFFILFLVGSVPVMAGGTEKENPDSIPFYEMTLEQLMNVNVTVASDRPMISRESPGIVSVITQEEIRKSGAHDLIEVLQRVPGFDFGYDVEGVVGIAVRGNWGHEGKVLLIWDGIEMNEDLYSTLQFGGHYPVSLIKRIEIIRGPGSAMYGANAEYAVINIVTQTGELDGLSADISSYSYENTFSGYSSSIAIGKKTPDGRINFSAAIINSKRSNKHYTDNYGNSYDMSNQSGLSSSQFKMEFTKKGFSFVGLLDNYTTKERDGYDAIYLRAYSNRFYSSNYISKYEFNLPHLKITPGFKYVYSRPWFLESSNADDNSVPYNTTNSKGVGFLNFVYEPISKLSVIAGADYSRLHAEDHLDSSFFTNGNKTFNMNTANAYVQALLRNKIANVIIGGRYFQNQYYGQKFVPRLGLTHIWEAFHVKALFSQAFRAPSVENINLSPDIKPEGTTFVELEFGFKANKHSYFTINAFDITTTAPIVYYYNELNEDDYKNAAPSGTRGFEVEYKWKAKQWYASANYSYYTTQGHPIIDIYQVPGHSDLLLAFPKHKINLTGSVNLYRKWSLSPTIYCVSERYNLATSESGTTDVVEFVPALYFDLNINAENIFYKGFSLNISCHNISDESVLYIQPYASNHAVVPGGGREYSISLNYIIPFKK